MANYTNTSAVLPQNTISISGAAGQIVTPWNNVSVSLDPFRDHNVGPHVKKYEVLEIEEDLLALSTAWMRLRQECRNGGPYVSVDSLTDKNLFKYVTETDREKAGEVRDYYSKKVMMWTLKGQKLSKFREDMNSFIHTNGKVFKKDFIPMVYRLPEFHEYDVEFDKLTAEHSKCIKDQKTQHASKVLTLQKSFIVGKKFTKRKEYWFSDENDNLVTMSFSHDNPLLSLLDTYSKNSFKIEGRFSTKARDNVDYFVVEKYSFS